MIKPLIVAGLVFVGVFGSASLVVYHYLTAERTTLTRISPDETIRAALVEPVRHFDRNFQLRLDFLRDGETTVLFRSPDEGEPFGTERLIWSKDGTKLLLVGRHFFVKDDLFLENGDQAYFLYDLAAGKGWCNSAQQLHYPPLKAEQLTGVEFTEPVTLKGD